MNKVKVSIIIVSFNTKGLLRRCFDSIKASAESVPYEVIVVDNCSKDGTIELITAEYPDITLIESGVNLGFAAANNLGYSRSRGEYVVLLNTDAFLVGPTLREAVEMMDARPDVGLAGARLTFEDGSWQPSARSFPGLWNEFLTFTSLAQRYSKSRLFGRPDFTWRDQGREILCDWVPGAFSIIRRSALDDTGLFDPRFFMYFEEVDLCRRIKGAGWDVVYLPSLQVIHIGGASASGFSSKLVSSSGRQMSLWRLQSQYQYYRKHHGWLKARSSMLMETAIYALRRFRNRRRNPSKREECEVMLGLIAKAWKNTRGGLASPPVPWQGA